MKYQKTEKLMISHSMNSKMQSSDRHSESGNVLFLILIAVALFAALSYAVTQSSRSGAGDTSSETNLISSAQLTQYPAGIRTAIVRMVITGTPIESLHFSSPAVMEDDSAFREIEDGSVGIFHVEGGGATYQLAPADVVTGSANGDPAGTWYFNMDARINGIGTTPASGTTGNDIIAFLPHISDGVCKRINKEVGIIVSGGAIPEDTLGAEFYATNKNHDDDISTTVGTIGNADDHILKGQPFGCFRNTTGNVNVYYHVLMER
jgi:hypothetical protein